MRVFYFTEQPYPAAWGEKESLRVTLPNQHCEPVRAADLYNRYLDEWMLADELGLDIMINEHHSTATCISTSIAITLGILARQTHKARLLVLGVPIANRPDPVRVAEEVAMADVISRGRVELGLVKGVPYEIAPANLNPVGMTDRFWEAHDLIMKALTYRNGPFNWEGDHFHYRQINIWPRPYQEPRPPVWMTALNPASVQAIAKRDYTVATMLNGYQAKDVFAAYRRAAAEMGKPQPDISRFAYLAAIAVADNRKAAMERADHLLGYFRTSGVVYEPFKMPPGYIAPKDYAMVLKHSFARKVARRDGQRIDPSTASVEDLIEAGLIFAGTPDEVYRQITEFSDAVGGIGNLLMMGQAGNMSHEETVDNMTLFSKEVLPRLQQRNRMTSAA